MCDKKKNWILRNYFVYVPYTKIRATMDFYSNMVIQKMIYISGQVNGKVETTS